MSQVPKQSASDEIEVTLEMIEAGLRAWRASAAGEYPHRSFINELVVEDIYRAMRKAAVESRHQR